MSEAVNIFLVEPIDHARYKAKIVYSDNAKSARIAASTAHNIVSIISPMSKSGDIDMVYLDENLSICIPIEPTIIEADDKMVKLTYQEKVYYLFKDEAENILETVF